MSDRSGTGALTLAIGAAGGVALWYLLSNRKNVARSVKDVLSPVPPMPAPVAAPPVATATPSTCALRLDATGLTADGVRVGVDAAVQRCKSAGRAHVAMTKDAPATAFADLSVALARAGVPVMALRNAGGRRRRVNEPNVEEFAQRVHAIAATVEADPMPDGRARGRFGDRKVFIAAIRRKLNDVPRSQMDELFLRANRDGLLQLARADLVSVMDPAEVAASEIVDAYSTFHFVISEREPTEAAHVALGPGA